jgi:hypothetical protein
MTIYKITPRMKFPTITIPDPAAVGKWLDEQAPSQDNHRVHFMAGGCWTCYHWNSPTRYFDANGDTPEDLLADIRRQLAENDPLAKLRAEADKHGYVLTKMPTD